MASSNTNNTFINNENLSNMSSISTSSHQLSADTSMNETSRRSARLSEKSPQITSKSINQSNVHRTVSGGVTNSHSPKLNNRKRSSTNNRRASISNALSQIIINDNVSTQNRSYNTTFSHSNLPSDQSEDDEVPLSNNTNNVTSVPSAPQELAHRKEVLSYFTEEPGGFRCKTCNKIYRASKLSDANLRKHLSSAVHQIPNVLFKSQINTNSKSDTTPISPERKEELYAAAVNCVVEDGLPFNVFRRPGMSKFLSTLMGGFRGPHRKTVRKRIGILYSLYRVKLRSVLSEIGVLALTTDLWKSKRNIHFISLIAHAFTHDYQHIPIVLGCRRIIGSHVATAIEKYIVYELNRLDIKPHQVISITTDNGSNIKKATASQQFGKRISCMVHNFNLVVKKGVCLWAEPNPKHFPLTVETNSDEWEDMDEEYDDIDNESLDENNTVDSAESLINDDDDDDVSDNGETTYGVTISSESEDDNVETQLSSLTSYDKSSSPIDHFQLLNNVYLLMRKTRCIIKFLRNHSTTNEFMDKAFSSQYPDKKLRGLVFDMIVRWNSSYLLLERFILYKNIISNILDFPSSVPNLTEKQRTRLKELFLTQSEWEMLLHLKHILGPFYDATVALSAETYPTMSICFRVLRLLSFFLQPKHNDHSVVIALKESLRYWFNIQCIDKLPQGQMEIMLVAAFLDPMIYKKMDDPDRKAAKKIIFNKLKKINVNLCTSSSSSLTTATSTSITSKLSALEKLAAACGYTNSSSTINEKEMTIDEEISYYIKSTKSAKSFREFWTEYDTKYPRLSYLVRRTNVIPATSISSEALFSVASFIQRKQRMSLSSKTLKYLLVLKNRHVLDKFVNNSQ